MYYAYNILKRPWNLLEFLVWKHKPEVAKGVHLRVKNHVLYMSIINSKK